MKGKLNLVKISKEEACAVRKVYPKACITRTVNRWYLEESPQYLSIIPGNVEAASLLEQEAKARKRKNLA